MIILNGINFLILRLPLAVLSFYSFIFRFNRQLRKHEPNLASYIVCKRFRFCKNMENIFYFVYLNSFLFQFLIFYKLDTNFKDNFLITKKKIAFYKKVVIKTILRQ